MKLGAVLSPVDGTNAKAITDQAVRLEGAGFSSIWSAQAMGRGFMMSDPFIALSAVAAVTDHVRIGTAILQTPLYHPADVALKSYALAQLSNNRFILGVGAGSTKSDYRIYQADFAGRFELFDKRLAALKHIFDTDLVGDIQLATWPSVNAPPIYFGTWDRNVSRAATEFDGWITSGMHRNVVQAAEAIKKFRAAGGKHAVVSTIQVLPDQDPGSLREKLIQYQEAGFDEAAVMLFPGGLGPEEVTALIS